MQISYYQRQKCSPEISSSRRYTVSPDIGKSSLDTNYWVISPLTTAAAAAMAYWFISYSRTPL